MKKLIFIQIILFAFTCSAQKIGAGIGIGIFSTSHEINNSKVENYGFSLLTDVEGSYEKNLFALSHIVGTEFTFMSVSEMSFREINLMYGRSLPVSNNFQIEGMAGVGYFHYKNLYDDYNYVTNTPIHLNESRVGFPLRVTLRFFPQKRVSFGLKTNYNINSFSPLFSQQLFGTFNFR